MPHIEMLPRHQPFPKLSISSWLVFLGVCGNTSSEEKNSTANSGVFSIDSLSNGHQGSFSSHTQDQERNIKELEMAQTQSLMPRLRPQLSALPLKVIILLLHSRTWSKENRLWSPTSLAQKFFFVLYLPCQADRGYLTPLTLSFLIFKMEINAHSAWLLRKNVNGKRENFTVPGLSVRGFSDPGH